MMGNQVDPNKGLTRRAFLGSVAAVTAGTAVAVSALSACSAGSGGDGNSFTTTDNNTYDVIETDVVVVGGGIAGMIAAKKVVAENQNVILVDKGPFGHSGASGINWGHAFSTMEYCNNPDDSMPELVMLQEGMGDQQYLLSLCQNSAESHAVAFSHKAGCISYRAPDGVAACKPSPDATQCRDQGLFPRLWAHSLLDEGINVIDRTMVVDIATSPNGEACGVIAIDLTSGNAKVIRAKAVVMATGPHAWTFGKCSNGARSMSGPECTGDGFSIFLKHGAELVNMEHLNCTPTQFYPEGIAYGVGTLYAGVMSWNLVCDADGNVFTGMLTGGEEVTDVSKVPTFGGQPSRMMLRALYDEGEIYVISDDTNYPRYLKRVQENQEKFLGYDCAEYVQLDPELFETAGHPIVDTTGESTITNLFWAGSGEGSWRGIASTYSIGSGYMAGKGAAQRASEIDAPELDREHVNATIDECYELLRRDKGKGKSAIDVYTSIQETMYSACYPIRTEEQLKNGIAELERIKREDFPTMHVRDGSKLCNTEWRQALEASHMWNCVMATAQSALARTETRGNHIRLDYPTLDHDNWLKYVAVSMDGSTWKAEPKDFDTSIVSKEEIKTMIAGDASMFEDVEIH